MIINWLDFEDKDEKIINLLLYNKRNKMDVSSKLLEETRWIKKFEVLKQKTRNQIVNMITLYKK